MLGVTDSQCVVAAVLDATSLALAARARHKIEANFVPSHCKYAASSGRDAGRAAVSGRQAACQSTDGDKDPRCGDAR